MKRTSQNSVGLLSVACLLAAQLTASAHAQQKQADPDAQLLTYFYKDPRPERLVGFAERYQLRSNADKWSAYPPLVGFFAAVCTRYPIEFEGLVSLDLKPKMATAIAAAVRLCNNEAIATKLLPALQRNGADKDLIAAFAAVPAKLDDVRITTPTHLDILWGASFASGDARYVATIVDYLEQTTNRSESTALDVAQTVLAMAGGPKEILGQLREKYGADGARQIIYSASALWALQSNAKQHEFVKQCVMRYDADHPGTPATIALSVFLAKGRKT